MTLAFTTEDVLAARSELAKRDLADFSCMVDIPTVPLSEDDEEDRFNVMKLNKLAAHHALLLEKLQGVEEGTVPNLMILMPPGSAKSTYVDVVFVPWFMARRGRRNVILASYASDIAKKQGRRARQLINSPGYQRLMGVSLKADQKAADEWALSNGSEYMSGGILSGLTGNRAALGIWDDLIKGRQQAESQTVRDSTWDAYIDDFCSRLIPGAPQVGIMCMTGDTPVRMADGTERPISAIRAGDEIATYNDGKIETSTVLNWANQGPDFVYEMKTTSGISVRANERHPFLVSRRGKLAWTRLKDIRAKDLILRAIGGNGSAFGAAKTGAKTPYHARGSAKFTTVAENGPRDTDHHPLREEREKTSNSGTAMALELTITNGCSKSKRRSAQSASETHPKGRRSIGAMVSVLTTTTKPEPFADFSAMTATSLLEEGVVSNFSDVPFDTWSVITDEVLSILPYGHEDVFDIQVDRTENFIANGLVSHNTRWHQDDVAGRILPENWNGESGVFDGRDGRIWHVLCIPAIADRPDDPLGRKIGETLWPEWFNLAHWAPFQKNVRTWTSLYQQKPTAAEGTFFKRDWFRRYENHARPKNLRYYMTSDHAPGDTEASDWNVFRVWGVDEHSRMWEVDGYRDHGTLDSAVGIEINPASGEQTLAEVGALALIKKWKPLCWFPENDNNWKSAKPFILAAMKKHKIRCRIEEISTAGGDKATKAQAFQAKASMGEVFIRAGFAGDAIIEEYVAFPGGKHDDEVDAAANMGRALDMAHPAIVQMPELADTDTPRDLYSRPRDDYDGGMYG